MVKHDEALLLPDALRGAAERVARDSGATLNQFVASAVAEKLSALEADAFFTERGTRADLAAFDRLMSRSGGAEPSLQDAWRSEGATGGDSSDPPPGPPLDP